MYQRCTHNDDVEAKALLEAKVPAKPRALMAPPPEELKRMIGNHILAVVFFIGAMVISVLFFSYLVENWPIVDSLYFAVVTMTTVGYGDKIPTTAVGEFVTMCLALVGISIVYRLLEFVVQKWFLSSTGEHEKSNFQYYVILSVVIFCTFCVAILEGWDPFTTLYFVVVTGVTLGYGDVTPQTYEAKLICVVYIPMLVICFTSQILNKINHHYMSLIDQYHVAVDKAIEDSLSGVLTEMGFDKLNTEGDTVSLTEFIVGMLTHFRVQFKKSPDRALVEKLAKKFKELDVSNTGSISKEDLEKWKEKYEERKKKDEKEINENDFSLLILLEYSKVPEPEIIQKLKVLFKRMSGGNMSITKTNVLDFKPNGTLEIHAHNISKGEFEIGSESLFV